jgi:hypothetical protein
MAMTNWSGPINVENGYITPITYIFETSLDGNREVKIDAGANVVILSAADGGPVSTCKLVLPLVKTINGDVFSITNADPYFNGIKGSVLNYGSVEHTLIGADDGTQNQPVNLSTTGVKIDNATGVQWGGNGNPAAPWAAIITPLAVAP